MQDKLHDHDLQEATGTIWAVFGHRFAVEGTFGRFLADVGPEGAESLVLKAGDTVTVRGERKPSELKVKSIVLADGSARDIAWPKKKGGPGKHAAIDPTVALSAVRKAGFEPVGDVRRKPKHFEVPASRDGVPVEVHVELDGSIRKIKPEHLREVA